MAQKKPPKESQIAQVPGAAACPRCEYLEQQVDSVIGHIRRVIETPLQSLREKVREIHRWQEKRDEAIEEFYTHRRTHRIYVDAEERKIA